MLSLQKLKSFYLFIGGNYPDIENIMTIAQKYNLYVVEDACMGIGGIINSKIEEL